MKRIKCYGKKKSRLIETSATKHFFGDISKNSSVSSQEKSFQADDDDLKYSKVTMKKNVGTSNENIFSNWKKNYIKYKYSKSSFKSEAVVEESSRPCETSHLKSGTTKKKSIIKKKCKKFENITSTPKSKDVMNLGFNERCNKETAVIHESEAAKKYYEQSRENSIPQYFDERLSNETAINSEISAAEKYNEKGTIDSISENLSPVSYFLNNDSGFCILKNGRVIRMRKAVVPLQSLSRRTVRYYSALSSNRRNSIKRIEKKLKFYNSSDSEISHLKSGTIKKKSIIKQKFKKFEHITSTPKSKDVMNLGFNERCNKEAAVIHESEAAKKCYEQSRDSIPQYFDEKRNNETAINFEILAADKYNEKGTVNSISENLSPVSYFLNNESGFCILKSGSVLRMRKAVVPLQSLSDRTIQYYISLSSNQRNSIKKIKKKLKFCNSSDSVMSTSLNLKENNTNYVESLLEEVSIGSEIKQLNELSESSVIVDKKLNINSVENNPSNELEVDLSEETYKCLTLQTLVYNEIKTEKLQSCNETSTRNPITCNLRDKEGNSGKETKNKLVLQNFDEVEDDCVILTPLKETEQCVGSSLEVFCDRPAEINSSNQMSDSSVILDKNLNANASKIMNPLDKLEVPLNEIIQNIADSHMPLHTNVFKESEIRNLQLVTGKSEECQVACNLSSPELQIPLYETEVKNTCLVKNKNMNLYSDVTNIIAETSIEKNSLDDKNHSQITGVCTVKNEEVPFNEVQSFFKGKQAVEIVIIDGPFCSRTQTLSEVYLKKKRTYFNELEDFCNENIQNCKAILKSMLLLTGQKKIIDFKKAYDWSCYTATRMGESSCGEIFKLSTEQSSVILKIIVIEPEQNKLRNLLAEMKIFMCLDSLRNEGPNHCMNFCELKRALVVRGEFPSLLEEAWSCHPSTSCAFDPHKYGATQKYLIFEMDDGGIRLSEHMPQTQKEALSVLLQLGLALAVAEEAFLFEHRDLHLDNVLIQKSNERVAYFCLKGVPIVVHTFGWKVTIIDFSLSKIVLNDMTYFIDLSCSEEIFQQQGNAQYELYRTMRHELKNKWNNTLLRTNMMWLQYILQEMFNFLTEMKVSGMYTAALDLYIVVTKESLSSKHFISRCIYTTHELYDTIFRCKKLNITECICID